ncbi:hypothetical protein P43SY_006872 [Pythium insidiosum]|uniref:MobA-like NTP transferase domain-containing protein n=1 Tax=Pythium insidiosum TaxID=114742 RepID=A0AAD5QC12_PYTIN|nr:hypothetical protein P43SY_006872 [Pythium insidiosum]
MVVHGRPTELPAEVPTAVYAVDLSRLSELLSIPENELVLGFQADPTRGAMHGVVVDAGEDVPFEAVGQRVALPAGDVTPEPPMSQRGGSFIAVSSSGRSASLGKSPPSSSMSSAALPPMHPSTLPIVSSTTKPQRLWKDVLLTAAARPSSLDSDELPKCLIQLGSQTIIAHILTQLYAAGVDRVVISVAAGGDKIMDAVRRTPYYTKMHIEFLNLGPDNRDGHARSILAARQYFTRGPFLIHTADHIFDRSIITKFMAQELNENVACVLVETDVSGLVGLPETTVKVQLGPEKILRIGRDLNKFDGIDAGLFLSSVKIFEALDDLASKKSYFSFADALNYFTKFNKLTYLPTSGETWFSIETEEQLAYTKDNDGVSVLSPWTVFLATTPQCFAEDPNVKKSVVIGISAGDKDSGLRVVGSTDSSRIFQGFIVGVANADRRDDDLWAGAFGGAAYFMIAKTLRPKMDLLTFMSCLTGVSATCLLITMLLTGQQLSFSMNTHHGIFGWLNPTADRILIAFYLVFVCDLIGTMGYISVLKYFDPIVL